MARSKSAFSLVLVAGVANLTWSQCASAAPPVKSPAIGRHTVTTLPMPVGVNVRSGTYTPSGT